MNRYWCRFFVRFEEMPFFEYHGPWWETGVDNAHGIICAAVCAESEEAAKAVIEAAFDEGHTLAEWSFCNLREADWEPGSPRFPGSMQWPFPPPPC